MNLDEITWPELGPESHAMMAAAAARQYNRIASKLNWPNVPGHFLRAI